MRKYPKYKASGVEWLGEIPEKWDAIKMKFVGQNLIGLTYSPADIVDESQGVLVLRSSNIQQGRPAFSDCVYIKMDIPKKLITRIGDILLCARNGSADLVGKNICIDKDLEGVTFGAFMTIYRTKYWKFFSYFLNSEIFKAQTSLFNTTTINQLTNDTLRSMKVALPNLVDEQHAIVRFLDYKTGQIDSFIANRQRQIELLKEQKAGIINKAVTKGINPNAKMKEIGIKWIGEVPENWDFKSLRRITKEHRQGYYIDEPYITEGVKLVRITDLHSDGSIDYSEMPFVKISKEHEKLYTIEEGDFLFPRTGTIGSLGFVYNPERAVFASYLIRFRFKSNEVLNEYLYYYFMSDAFLDGVFSDLHGGVVQNIHAENIKNQFIAHPKELTEQEMIINYIKTETTTIDSLISKYQKQIDLMKEYRTSLISQAVTGKIDVREWQLKKQQTA